MVHLLNHLSSSCVDASDIKYWTDKDPLLSQVRHYVTFGWPNGDGETTLSQYKNKKNELSVLRGCVLRGARVIVPPQCRGAVLEELHETHTGSSKMKALARAYVWWPDIDTHIEKIASTCVSCQHHSHSPPSAPLHPWEWPKQPWSRVHLDFAGPFMGSMFLVTVDAHSKWLDVQIMSSITALKTIEKLRQVFATHGLPYKIVTDNGPTFISHEFKQFLISSLATFLLTTLPGLVHSHKKS